MEGLDKSWKDVGYRRTVYFPHLPAGKYIFKAIATSIDGVSSKVQSSLPITVLPPFYLTNWFVVAVSGLVIFAVFSFWNYRMKQQRGL